MTLRVALNIPDCHIPWHNEDALEIMFQVAKDIKPDEINILGDFADAYFANQHPKSPSDMQIKETLLDEIEQVKGKLQRLRNEHPKATINYIEGNHEFRLQRYLANKCPELFGILNYEDLVGLKDLQIKFYPFGRHQLVRCLGTDYLLRHQPYAGGTYCAGGSIAKKKSSLGFGHTHRIQSHTCTNATGDELVSDSIGCLVDFNAPIFDYVDSQDWALGFQVFYAFNKKVYFREQVRILDGKAAYNGKVYTRKGVLPPIPRSR